MHDVVVKRVFHIRRRVLRLEQPHGVRFVLGEQPHRLLAGRRVAGDERQAAQCRVLRDDARRALAGDARLVRIALSGSAPRPRIAKPERRQHVQRRVVRPAVRDGDANADVVGRGLRVLRNDVEVSVLVEDPGVGELEFRIVASAPLVLGDELPVRKLTLADTCRAPRGTTTWAWRRGSSSTPSRPRRGCPPVPRDRRAAP